MMKKSRKWLIGVGMLSLFGLGILVGKYGEADEKKVYIPSAGIREQVIKEISHSEENNNVENELPTSTHLAQIKEDHIIFSNQYEESTSLEGLQEIKDVKGISLLMFNNIIDYRPLGGMENLQYIQLYYFPDTEDPVSKKAVDVSFVKNLKKLRIFDGGVLPVLDLTPFQ
ncbi:hypothetical protein [Enterococcus caccae]|uniref:Uncharacterized protein n=1 Tax=Enterococcus caccae ATCC BAA-1240 TaxID=1158612 RepID=R3TXW9_9ENTE|nr:hypothetical protein [Enterococcus caccae]EOL45963.1 hypothetical protein UC7_01760 [Enterococcus caccae ATCC BAA-1240]EOT61159.1 hypothetical protein I580_02061 [Enterococcus caccae ATCC BAA-1240]OJG27810.1 hypothetical protein RU98_GL002019 [Enterococcus caccae]